MNRRGCAQLSARARTPLPRAAAVVAAPTVSAIAPVLGSTDGGVAVTITGTGFTGATGATIGGIAVTSFVIVNSTTITGKTGAHAVNAAVDVAVTNAGGTGTGTGLFEYWNPTVLGSALKCWLHAEKGITTSSGNVTTWADQSGGGNDFNQALSAKAPAYTAAALNGLHGLTFGSALTDVMYLRSGVGAADPLSRLIAAAAYTVALVLRWTTMPTDSANSYDNAPAIADGGGFWGYHGKSTGPTARAFHYSGADKHADKTVTTGTGTEQIALWWYDGTNISHQLGGGSATSTAAGDVGSVANSALLGQNYSGTASADARIFEVVVCNTALSAGNRSKLVTYLQGVWAL